MIDKEAKLNHIEQTIDKLIKIASNKTLHLHDEITQVNALKDEYFKIKADLDNAPVTSATKINVLKRELLATPSTEGYDISAEGKKLFNIVGKDRKPMNKKQLEFCAQIELTRGMKQAKLTEKVAHLEAGSTVFVMAEDKAARRVKFASIEHGIRGWVPMSKVAFLVKEGQMMKHKDHIDNTFGHNGKETLVDCPNGSGNMVWLPMAELLPIGQPPATPESLNDTESAKKEYKPCPNWDYHHIGKKCETCGLDERDIKRNPKEKKAFNEYTKCSKCKHAKGEHGNDGACVKCEKACKYEPMKDIEAAKECSDCHGHFEGKEGETCPTCGRFAVTKEATKKEDCPYCGSSWYKPEENWCPTCIRHPKKSTDKKAFNEYTKCSNCKHAKGEHSNDGTCVKCGKGCKYNPIEVEALETALPKQILPQRGDVNEMNPSNGPSDEDVQQKAWELFKQHWDGLSSEQMDEVYRALGVTSSLKMAEYKDKGVGEFECFDCSKRFVSKGKLDEHMDSSKHKSPKKASLNKIARVVHREDGWHVLSEKGKNLGGPYESKGEAVKRLRQVEYFKHHGAIRPFSRKVIAETLANPYQSLTDHITDMRGRMSEVQDRIQTVPAIKTAGEDNSKLDLPGLFADLTQGIELLETKLGGDENADPEIHAQIEELENKLWTLEESCGITPKISDEEKAEPEHKEIVEDIEKEAADKEELICARCHQPESKCGKVKGTKCYDDVNNSDPGWIFRKRAAQETMATKCTCGHMWKDHTDDNDCSFEDCDCKGFKRLHKQADQVTDETVVTNDPNAVVDPTAVTPPPMIQNVQPTDNDNLNVPVATPTSPTPPGTKWVFDTQFNKYVIMPDGSNPGKQI